MKVTEDKIEYRNACMDTPYGAACVKRRGKTLTQLMHTRHSHGLMVKPAITQAMLKGHPQGRLSNLVNEYGDSYGTYPRFPQPGVMVRGHGWGIDGDEFVWTGTVAEFNETWEVD